jgi:hypothetical protein
VAELSLAESAQAAGVAYRTWARFVERWHHRRIDGVTTRVGRARAGRIYVVDPSVVDRYHRCELLSR